MLARGHPAPSPGLQGHLVATQNQATPASETVHSHTPRKPTKAPIRWSVRWHLRGCCNVECLVYKSILNVSGLRTPLTQRFICVASDRTMAAAHKPCPPPSIMPRPCAPTRPRQDHVAPCPWLSRGRFFRRSLSILRSPHPQQRQERPSRGSWSSVPQAQSQAWSSTGRPRGTCPHANRDGPLPVHPPESGTASGTAPLMTGHAAWAFRDDVSCTPPRRSTRDQSRPCTGRPARDDHG